jgi:hypothetical protein
MKKYIPTATLALSTLITIVAVSSSVSTGKQRDAAKQETDALRDQIAGLRQTADEPLAQRSPMDDDHPPESDTNLVAELEAELAILRGQLAAVQEKEPEQRESWDERMARMKEEDPEGYADMINQRNERREAMRYGLAERTASFMELDSTFMSDEERENHDLLIQKMGDFWALTEQLQDPEQRPSRETMQEFRSLVEEVRPLMNTERSTMFRQLADDLGMAGEDAQEFSSYVQDIIDVTTIRMHGRGGRGGGRGR